MGQVQSTDGEDHRPSSDLWGRPPAASNVRKDGEPKHESSIDFSEGHRTNGTQLSLGNGPLEQKLRHDTDQRASSPSPLDHVDSTVKELPVQTDELEPVYSNRIDTTEQSSGTCSGFYFPLSPHFCQFLFPFLGGKRLL